MLVENFIGPAYRARSQNVDAETLYNLYVETISSSGNAKRTMLIGRPALKFLQNTVGAGCRGWFAQDGVQLVVMGSRLYSLDTVNTTVTDLGEVHDSIVAGTNLVSFASNGRGGEQIAIVGGGFLYILDLTTMMLSAPVTLPLTNNPVQLGFIDGYFLLVEEDSIRVWFSALFDGTMWDALDFFARSQSSDNVIGLKVLRDKVWIFGTLTTDAYYDSGDADIPFVPYSGSLMQEGAITPWAIGVQGELLIWLSQDNEGQGRMVVSGGDTPQRVSTPAVEFALAQYRTLEDAELMIWEQEGHSMACFQFPSGGEDGQSWCYDSRETQTHGEPIWWQPSSWDTERGVHVLWRARTCCQAANVILSGDRFTTDLYTLDLNTYADACGIIAAERTAPYLSGENQLLFIDQVELGAETGVGLNDDGDNPAEDVDPHAMLTISRDSAHTFDPPMTASLGREGEYAAYPAWRQCGRSRADRLVFRVRVTASVKRVWGPGLWLRATPGWGGR